MELSDWALRYAELQMPVFPLHTIDEAGKCTCGKVQCASPAKHPRTGKGLNDATTDIEVVTRWWKDWVDDDGEHQKALYPDSNIGIRTGSASGLFVIDVDAKSGGLESWSELQDIYGPASTLSSRTGGGGNHYIYKIDGQTFSNSVSQLGQGIDTRGEGGYIVVSPSVHESGIQYAWEGKIGDIAPLPDWLAEKLSSPSPRLEEKEKIDIPVNKNPTGWAENLEINGADEGNRNTSVVKLCGWYIHQNYSLDVIKRKLAEFNDKCSPPLPERELQAAITSGTRYYQQVTAAKITDPPDFREELNTLIYTFPRIGLQVTVDDPNRANGTLNTVISFDMITDTGMIALAGPLSWIVTSISQRETLSKTLWRRLNSNEIDWDDILQILSRLIDAHDRAGRVGLVDLRDFQERPWSQFALDPFILDELPSILFGFGGLGKSLIALAVMASLNSGAEILPGLIPEQGHKGAYLDWESSSWEHGIRYRQIMVGAGLNPDDYEMLHLPLSSSLEVSKHTISKYIQEHSITFLILDSAAMSAGGNPIDIEAANKLFETLRALNLPSLIIAHQTKGNEKDQTPFGSVFWHNNARVSHQIAKQQSPGDSVLNIALLNRKMNSGGERKPLGFQLEFTDAAIYIRPTDIQDNPELAKHTRIIEQVRAALAERKAPLTADQIIEMKDLPNPSSAKSVISRWTDKTNGVKKLTPNDEGYRPGETLYTLPDEDRNTVI